MGENLSRRSLLGGLAAVGAAGTTIGSAQPAAAQERRRRMDVRVLSYNIHHGAGVDGILDLERIAKVVEASGAGIVGLQEVDKHFSDRSEWVDQPAWFADRLGMHVAYGANLDLEPPEPGKPRRQYGTAILSRWPIESWRNTFLPKFGDHEQRGLLEAVIAAGDTTVKMADTHLQHNDAAERFEQAKKVVELLGEAPQRTFLVGDFNADPGTPEIGVLTDVYVDSWAKAGSGDGFTYPAEAPTKRIDYVFASPDAAPTAVDVLEGELGSDHLPYVVGYRTRC